MKAIVRKQYGSADELEIREVPRPEPGADAVLIRVKAFGLNRAEIYMRQGLWGEVAPISGIECVGTVAEDPAGEWQAGQTVAALMGGMGRSIDGSYAEYVAPPRSNVIPIETDLPWEVLAAVPESYATAWACLHQNIGIEHRDSLLVRGGTSALGQAAINIAAARGIEVLGTTRQEERLLQLSRIGCTSPLIDTPELSQSIRESHPDGLDAVLDLVGNSTLLDSLKMVRKGGVVCTAGFLGGGDPIAFNPLADLPSGVNLNFFASFMFGTPDFPLTDIPLQHIVEQVEKGVYRCEPARVFGFDEIRQAHRLMESNDAGGKIVIMH